MKNKSNPSLTSDERRSVMIAAMDRITLISEKVAKGEASESELAEYNRINDKLNSVPRDEVRG